MKKIIKKLKYATLIALFASSPIKSHASDKMFKTSTRCSRYFKTVEKKYHIPENLVKAVAITESGLWSKAAHKKVAWPWTINVQGKGYRFETKQAAILAIRKFQKQGIESIDVGCMQINLKYHPDAFHNLGQALEPIYNIDYAARLLKNHYRKTGHWKTAIKHYHSVKQKHGNRYLKQVYKNWRIEDKAISIARATPKPTPAEKPTQLD